MDGKELLIVQDNLVAVLEVLETANRIGSDKDEPEGSRYIQISDTLSSELIKGLMLSTQLIDSELLSSASSKLVRDSNVDLTNCVLLF